MVNRTETERGDRLLQRLLAEVGLRQDLLSRHGYADVSEQRLVAEEDERLPYLVLLLDQWEGYLQYFDDVDSGRVTAID